MLPNPLPDNFTLLTAIGAAKLADALANSTPLVITEFAVGDAGGAAYVPAVDINDYVTQTGLVNEVYRDDVYQKLTDGGDPTIVKIQCQIPGGIGGFTVREIGLFDADDDMIALMIYKDQFKPASGSGAMLNTMNFNFVMRVANTALVELLFANAEFAVLAELKEGTVTDKSATPKALQDYLSYLGLTNLDVNTDTSITEDDVITVCVTEAANLTIFDPADADPKTAFSKRWQIYFAADYVSLSVENGKLISGLASRVFNTEDMINLEHDGTNWIIA